VTSAPSPRVNIHRQLAAGRVLWRIRQRQSLPRQHLRYVAAVLDL